MQQIASRPLLLSLAAVIAAVVALSGTPAVAQDTPRAESPKPPATEAKDDARPSLASVGAAEQLTLEKLLAATSWTKRAIAVLRLERFGCAESRALLVDLLSDESWQVRAFAVQTLARRREPAEPDWFVNETEPRVFRAVVRHRYPVDPARLDRGVRQLARSEDLQDKMLAAEIAAASDDEDLKKLGREAAKKVILRMQRAEAGAFSPRLALVTGEANLLRAHRWQKWLIERGRLFRLQPAYAIDDGAALSAPSLIADLADDRFAALDDYIDSLSTRKVDLAICLDCTASMWGELAAAQAGVNDMMLFTGDVVSELRIALVAYRDRRDKYETKGWDFTRDISEASRRLWELNASGGGDTPEAVYPAMRFAFTQLTWMPEHNKVLIVIGDAPPHVGYGTQCIDMARRAAENELITHVIQTEDKEVPHFPEIAEAGGGQCVSLDDDDKLIAEITGLTLGEAFSEEFREFFGMYLSLCR